MTGEGFQPPVGVMKAASPDALLPAPQLASEVARRIADDILDAYTKEDWHYVLNALRPDRAPTYLH